MNWRAIRTASIALLVLTAGLLFGMGSMLGISNLSSTVFGSPFTWMQVLAVGQIYILYSFLKLIKA